jgi:peptide deformylase
MSILKVARLGHPILRARARPVDRAEMASPQFQRLIDDMLETMNEYAGIGLAGPQVHAGLRVFVAGLKAVPIGEVMSGERDMPLIAVVNPEITPIGADVAEGWEGCLSIPDMRGRVPRAKEILVRAFDRHGKRLEFRAKDLPARVIQHETDHLDGVMFFDRMLTFETLSFMDEYNKYWAPKDDEDDEEKDDNE